MAFGGLGLMMFSGPPALWSINLALRRVDIQSLFFASMFLVILVILAYLTNPSETSFRTFLTEQSFRQHLRRLEDDNHDDQSHRDDTGVHYTLSPRRLAAPAAFKQPGRSYDPASTTFHFTNRASVALRTPKHLFQSFGIFTIAAIVPSGARSQSHHGRRVRIDGSGAMVSNSWYIGAFGKWWRGGALQSWWIETVANTKDAERCNSGILDVKSLDSLEDYDGLLLTAPPPHLAPNGKACPPQLRDTARAGTRAPNSVPRSITPPPLPKSASLPLHAPRVTATASKGNNDKTTAPRSTPALIAPQQHAVVATATASTTAGVPSPLQIQTSPSLLFDQNPVISELLRQIALSKGAVVDVRASLQESQAVAAESRSAIQRDLDAQREQKRAEDAAKVELKTKNKTLEESKRSAEAVKREADKKLKQAESQRDKAAERIDRLDKEIEVLKERMGEDVRAMTNAKEEGDQAEEEMAKELELKKKEVKVAEDVVAALSARAKDLEEKITAEEELLKKAKEEAELRKQDRAFFPLHVIQTEEPTVPIANPWSPLVSPQIPVDPHTYIHSDLSAGIEVFPQSLHVPGTRSRGGSGSSGSSNPVPTDFSVSSRPRKLSLGLLSNLHPSRAAAVEQVNAEHAVQRTVGFPSFEDNLSSHSTRFSPFAETNELEVPVHSLMRDGGALSPKSSSLIPTSLIASLENSGGSEDLSRSFQSDTDDFLERGWRKTFPFPPQPVESPAAYSSSPTSLTHPSFEGVDREDPFEIRPPPPLRHRFASDVSDMQRAVFTNSSRSSSDPQSAGTLSRSRTRESDEMDMSGEDEQQAVVTGSGHRRWFSGSPSTKDKDKKGLNPEAKVFQFKKPFGSTTSKSQQRLSTLDTLGIRSMPISAPYNITALSNNNNGNHIMLPLPPHAHLSRHTHGDVSSSESDSIFSALSMHAFAPSPAEREELARRLGSSANTSLERIPTLSEVSIASLPSSPSHVHANAQGRPHQQSQQQGQQGQGRMMSGLPAWLAALPKVRKTKFSPWEEEEGVEGGEASF
ncbi:hypothetical protein EUX98_g889 [Antrodiella citrinella]|uniref:Uncharacterized protein n=1 Tax=Antrodiella citrinella TaxID=2447956 RepID=A0A4S4N2U5_9APHY|nr:hypothetical protein EUX98_g889 [Antrodiella citrinella]